MSSLDRIEAVVTLCEQRGWSVIEEGMPLAYVRALVNVAKAAEALVKTEYQSFIGWQSSSDRDHAIQSAYTCLREALISLNQEQSA